MFSPLYLVFKPKTISFKRTPFCPRKQTTSESEKVNIIFSFKIFYYLRPSFKIRDVFLFHFISVKMISKRKKKQIAKIAQILNYLVNLMKVFWTMNPKRQNH